MGCVEKNPEGQPEVGHVSMWTRSRVRGELSTWVWGFVGSELLRRGVFPSCFEFWPLSAYHTDTVCGSTHTPKKIWVLLQFSHLPTLLVALEEGVYPFSVLMCDRRARLQALLCRGALVKKREACPQEGLLSHQGSAQMTECLGHDRGPQREGV